MPTFNLLPPPSSLLPPLSPPPPSSPQVHGAYSSTVRPGATVPLHAVDGFIRVKPGELLPRDAYLKKVHILQLEVCRKSLCVELRL